ncbi:hypothetical protein FQN49_003876, partial [Arthroderma sp. PD_2]
MAGIHSPKSRFSTEVYQCTHLEEALINSALNDARLALRAAAMRLDSLAGILERKPGIADTISGIDRVTQWTFESIYVAPWRVEMDEEDKALNVRGLDMVKKLHYIIERMLDGFNDDGYPLLEIWCGDDFFSKTLPPFASEAD